MYQMYYKTISQWELLTVMFKLKCKKKSNSSTIFSYSSPGKKLVIVSGISMKSTCFHLYIGICTTCSHVQTDQANTSFIFQFREKTSHYVLPVHKDQASISFISDSDIGKDYSFGRSEINASSFQISNFHNFIQYTLSKKRLIVAKGMPNE